MPANDGQTDIEVLRKVESKQTPQTSRDMGLVATLLNREYMILHYEGKEIYAFDMGIEKSRKQFVFVHSKEIVDDADFRNKYPEMVRHLAPEDSDFKIFILDPKYVDYLKKNCKTPAKT